MNELGVRLGSRGEHEELGGTESHAAPVEIPHHACLAVFCARRNAREERVANGEPAPLAVEHPRPKAPQLPASFWEGRHLNERVLTPPLKQTFRIHFGVVRE